MKLIFLSFITAFILAGCSKELNITEPQNELNREWLQLNIHPDQKVENQLGTSGVINGTIGGQINLSESFYSNGKLVTVDVDLTIPADAFVGIKEISFVVNTEDATINLLPKMSFNKDLILNYKLTGLDLTGYNPELIDFGFLKNKTVVLTSYLWKKVDVRRGLLEVFKAKISHFSRYGWATIVEPAPSDE